MTYNAEGKRTSLENLAGQVTTTAWDQFACTPVGELCSAAKSAKHASAFDDIGNCETAYERAKIKVVVPWLEKLTCHLPTDALRCGKMPV